MGILIKHLDLPPTDEYIHLAINSKGEVYDIDDLDLNSKPIIYAKEVGEIEPVRHGYWVEVKSWESEKHSVTDMRCNLCGKYASLVLPHKTKCTYKYCPFCGAKMDV